MSAVAHGYSKRLGYMKNRRRISLAALRDVFFDPFNETLSPSDWHSMNRLRHLEGVLNCSDLLTKPMPRARHWELLSMCGMDFLPVWAIEQKEEKKKKERKKRLQQGGGEKKVTLLALRR